MTETPDGKHSTSSIMSKRFRGYLPVVIDVECGGFNAATDALLEVAAVLLDFNANGQLVRESTHFYRVVPFAGANLEESALKFTGINPHHPLRIAHPELQVLCDLILSRLQVFAARFADIRLLPGGGTLRPDRRSGRLTL